MNKHLPIALLVLAGLLVPVPSRADLDWHTIGWSNPITAEYPVGGSVSTPNCPSRCCYPSWLYESGYIWHSSTPPQPGNNKSQGDWSYDGWCTQSFINEMWHEDNWDFDTQNWDGGFGASINPCDRRLPLARMLVSLYVLKNSWGPTTPNDELGLILKNAYAWAKGMTDEVDAGCDKGDGSFGVVAYVPGGLDARTEFYWEFFYGSSVPERAMTVVHEARHSDGCSHNAESTGKSKDFAWNDGCDWGLSNDDGMAEMPSNAGARQYEAMWGWAFYRYGENTTPAVRARALAMTDYVLVQTFASPPYFRIGTDGNAYKVPAHLVYNLMPPLQNVFTILSSEQTPWSYLSYYPSSGAVTYDPLAFYAGSDFDWAVRPVDIAYVHQFDKVGSHQIYSTYNGQDYCLRPAQVLNYLPQYLWIDGSQTSTGWECEGILPATPLQAVLCSPPTDTNPQPRTWFQIVPAGPTDLTAEELTEGGSYLWNMWLAVHLKPTLRCREIGGDPGFVIQDNQCLTTFGPNVGTWNCLDLPQQRFNVSQWYGL